MKFTYTRFLFAILLLAVAALYNGCGETAVLYFATKDAQKSSPTADSANLSSNGSDDNNNNGNNPPPSTTGSVNLSTDVSAITTELADIKRVVLTVQSIDAYSGPIDLKIATPEIDALDPNDGIKITISPSTLTMSANSSAQATITIDVDTTAPSLAQHFHIEAYRGGTALIINEAEVDLSVQAIFRLKVKGVGDANWMIGETGKSFADRGNRVLNFRVHASGLQVLFDNYDITGRIIHSGGAIPHGNINAPLAASANAGVSKGGTYMPAKINGNALVNARVYLHNGEAAGAARTLNFNVP